MRVGACDRSLCISMCVTQLGIFMGLAGLDLRNKNQELRIEKLEVL